MKLFAADVAPPGFTGLDFLTLGSRTAFQVGFLALLGAVGLFFVLRRLEVAKVAAVLAALGLFIGVDVVTYVVVSQQSEVDRRAMRERRNAEYERREAQKARAIGSSAALAGQER